METNVAVFPRGCKRNVEVKMHFTVMLRLFCSSGKKNPSAISFEYNSHDNGK